MRNINHPKVKKKPHHQTRALRLMRMATEIRAKLAEADGISKGLTIRGMGDPGATARLTTNVRSGFGVRGRGRSPNLVGPRFQRCNKKSSGIFGQGPGVGAAAGATKHKFFFRAELLRSTVGT